MRSSASARPGSLRTIALAVCGLAALIDGADAQSLSIAAPLIAKALAISSAGVGLTFSIAACGGAVGYLGGGWLSDRLSGKAVAIASALVIGVFQWATAYVGDAVTLIASRFVVSLGLGALVPALVTIIAEVAPVRWRHRAQGLFWACFPVGVLSGGILNSWILTHSRWQIIFVVGGCAALVIALLLATTTPAATGTTTPGVADVADVGAAVTDGLWTRAVLTGLVFFFTQGAIAVTLNWTPFLLVRCGYDAATGAEALAWQAAGALTTMSVTGFIVERSKVWPIVFSLMVAACAIVLFATFIHSSLWVTLSMPLMGGFLALAGTASTFLAAVLLPGNRQATGIGLCLAIGRAGQMVFPGLIGLSLQAGGSSSSALLLTAALPACAAVAALILALRGAAGARETGSTWVCS